MRRTRRALVGGALAAAALAVLAADLPVTTVATSEPLPSRGRLGGVSVGADGTIWVSNFSASLFAVSPDGSVRRIDVDLRGASGNTVGHDGSVYQASFVDGRIVRVSPGGAVETWAQGGLDGPVGIVEGADGALYVCNCRRNDVSRIGRDRTPHRFATSEDFDCPNGIARDVDDTLVVVSFKNGHVVRLEKNGTARRIATLPDGGNAHVAVTPEALYVTRIASNRIDRIGRDGSVSRWAGNGAIGFTDGLRLEASLARPNGIAVVPDGSALVVNTLRGPWRGEEATEIVLRRIELGGASGATAAR